MNNDSPWQNNTPVEAPNTKFTQAEEESGLQYTIRSHAVDISSLNRGSSWRVLVNDVEIEGFRGSCQRVQPQKRSSS